MPVNTMIQVTCEGPRCKRGVDGKPFQITWNPEKAKQDMNEVPDAAWKLRTLLFFDGEQHVFCCTRCQHDWDLDNPVPIISPREKATMQTERLQPIPTIQTETGAVPLAPTDVPPQAPSETVS